MPAAREVSHSHFLDGIENPSVGQEAIEIPEGSYRIRVGETDDGLEERNHEKDGDPEEQLPPCFHALELHW